MFPINKIVHSILPFWITGYYLGTSLLGELRLFWFISLYGLAAFLMLTSWRSILPILLKEPWIPLLITLTGFSFYWSIVPDITFASFRSLIVQYILVAYIVNTYSFNQIISFVYKIFSFIGIVCFVNMLMVGGNLASSWRGVFAHQSQAAAAMAIAVISIFYFFLINRGWEKGWFFIISTISTSTICILVLISSGARTALVGCLASFSVLPLFYLNKLGKIKARTFGLIGLIYLSITVVSSLYIAREYIVVDLLGKRLDLTGRSFTWEFILEKLSERPMTGYGLDAFWHNQQIAQEFAGVVGRQIPSVYNSHSGYLDILVGLGIPGFILLCLLIISVVKRNLKLIINCRSIQSMWSLQIIILFLIVSYADSFPGPLKPRNVQWLIFSIVSLKSILELNRLSSQKINTEPNPYLSRSSTA